MLQKQMRCQSKAESLLFPTMYKSQKIKFPTCSGFCGSGSHISSGSWDNTKAISFLWYGKQRHSWNLEVEKGKQDFIIKGKNWRKYLKKKMNTILPTIEIFKKYVYVVVSISISKHYRSIFKYQWIPPLTSTSLPKCFKHMYSKVPNQLIQFRLQRAEIIKHCPWKNQQDMAKTFKARTITFKQNIHRK